MGRLFTVKFYAQITAVAGSPYSMKLRATFLVVGRQKRVTQHVQPVPAVLGFYFLSATFQKTDAPASSVSLAVGIWRENQDTVNNNSTR